MNRTYVGIRAAEGPCYVLVMEVEARRCSPLRPRLDLFNHSPTGFEWGYGGSGPAQLALAILADALSDDERAISLHQKFKFKVVGVLPRDIWRLEHAEVMATVRQLSN